MQTAITHNTSEEISFRGVSPLVIGFKTKLFPSKNILPDVYLMANVGLHKTRSKIYHGTFLSPSLNLIFGNQLNEKTSLQYNVGSKWDTGTGQQMTTYSISGLYQVTPKSVLFAEYFGYSAKNQSSNHHLDGGITYNILQNLTFENSVGFGLTENAPNYFANFKINYTFPVSKKSD